MEYFIHCEFNLLVFGVGSKIETMNTFVNTLSLPYLVVNGYHSGTTIKSVINSIANFID